ncbi:MAG TPA: response regulator [Anaeromyxobacter sp.]|nr:response regulator [Anaeromyxobacter sp.]
MTKSSTVGGDPRPLRDRVAPWVALGAVLSGTALLGSMVHGRLSGAEEALAAAGFLLAVCSVAWAWWLAEAARRDAIAAGDRVAAEAELRRAALRLAPSAASGRRGRILVIEGEPGVGEAVHRVLRRDDDVVATASGRDALRAIHSETDFDAVLCDVGMPGITGIDLYRMLQAELPALAERVVFVSGAASVEAREFLSAIPNRKVDKPLDPRALRAAVGSLMGRGGAASA